LSTRSVHQKNQNVGGFLLRWTPEAPKILRNLPSNRTESRKVFGGMLFYNFKPVERRKLQLQNEAFDMLLFDLLQELIYYKDTKKLMFRIHQIQIKKEGGQHVLKAIALGEKLDPKRHATRADVKAVTLHSFQLVETDQGWETQIILDIWPMEEKLCRFLRNAAPEDIDWQVHRKAKDR